MRKKLIFVILVLLMFMPLCTTIEQSETCYKGTWIDNPSGVAVEYYINLKDNYIIEKANGENVYFKIEAVEEGSATYVGLENYEKTQLYKEYAKIRENPNNGIYIRFLKTYGYMRPIMITKHEVALFQIILEKYEE